MCIHCTRVGHVKFCRCGMCTQLYDPVMSISALLMCMHECTHVWVCVNMYHVYHVCIYTCVGVPVYTHIY